MKYAALTIRRPDADDKNSVIFITKAIPCFTQEEKECALELFDLYIKDGEESGYNFLAAEKDGKRFAGYISFGRIPLTEGCFDIYWIVVSPQYRREGIGTALMAKAEENITGTGGRKVFAETSSRKEYLPAQVFYEKAGFRLVSDIKDYYRIGDGKLTYMKDLL